MLSQRSEHGKRDPNPRAKQQNLPSKPFSTWQEKPRAIEIMTKSAFRAFQNMANETQTNAYNNICLPSPSEHGKRDLAPVNNDKICFPSPSEHGKRGSDPCKYGQDLLSKPCRTLQKKLSESSEHGKRCPDTKKLLSKSSAHGSCLVRVLSKFKGFATCEVSCYRQPTHHPLQHPSGSRVGGWIVTMFMYMSSVLPQSSGVESRAWFGLLVWFVLLLCKVKGFLLHSPNNSFTVSVLTVLVKGLGWFVRALPAACEQILLLSPSNWSHLHHSHSEFVF